MCVFVGHRIFVLMGVFGVSTCLLNSMVYVVGHEVVSWVWTSGRVLDVCIFVRFFYFFIFLGV